MLQEDVIVLEHTVKFFIPTQCICGKEIDPKLRDEMLNYVKQRFYGWFGGATAKSGSGIWELPDGKIADEKIDIIDSSAGQDAYDDHIDDVKRLAVEIADKLSQDRVLLRIDGISYFYARSDPAARCNHKEKAILSDLQTTQDRKGKLVPIYYSLSDFKSFRDSLSLFCGELNYKSASGHLPCPNWPSSIKNQLTDLPSIISDTNGFKIVYIRLKKEKISRTAVRSVIRRIYQDDPSFTGLFIVGNEPQDQWEFVNAKWTTGKENSLLIRRIRVGAGERVRTAAERLSQVEIKEDEENLESSEIQRRHDMAFDVEAVTREFYDRYREAFTDLKDDLYKQTKDLEFAHDYALQFLNRCMFLYFIQRKGWLDNDPDFLKNFWQTYGKSGRPKNTFFTEWLSVLFFEAFNNKFHGGYSYFPDHLRTALQLAPWLNGGLFSRNQLDNKYDVVITDKRFEGISSFLNHYNFTISEDSPLDQEVAVDPEMIGKVYESLVNVTAEIDERGDAGIFYTARTEIDLMCRISLVDNLANNLGEEHKNLFYEFVFAIDEEEKGSADEKVMGSGFSREMWDHLRNITVLDIACGSGSFLVGMLHILNDLIGRLGEILGFEESAFLRKKQIIAQTLYGVDVMDWAVHVAELRLWLALIVDAELDQAQLKFSPLLPNLSFKIRRGDSLVQEIGGINLCHLKGIKGLGGSRRQIAELKKEKLKFYNNEQGRKLLDAKDVEREELRVFRNLLEAHAKQLDEERKRLLLKATGSKPLQVKMDGTIEGMSQQMTLHTEFAKRELEQVENSLELVRQAYPALKTAKDVPFLWDVAFVEVFSDDSDDKHGFDIVIGNPPYVRQESIADPNMPREKITVDDKKEYKEKLARSVYEAFPRFFGYNAIKNTVSHKIDAKSDLYIFFYFMGISLLNRKGTFCFITSNSWLDVGYGKDLQEFLLKHSHIKMIMDNKAKRSFASADVNTIIALLFTADDHKDFGLGHDARFIMFQVPFEQILSPVIFEEIESTEERTSTPEYRIFPVKQKVLLDEGMAQPLNDEEETTKKKKSSNGKYTGNKWGGKYLRAPDIYWTIQKKGKGILVRLGDVADVRRGFTTGSNEFFYLDENTIKEWSIEEEFLLPVLRRPKECERILLNPKEFQYKVFLCSKTKKELKGTNALKYIEYGEKQGFNELPTCASRALWYNLGSPRPTQIACKMTTKYRHYFPVCRTDILVDHRFYEVRPNDCSVQQLAASLNAPIVPLWLESTGRTYGGGGGPLDIMVYEIKQALLIDPSLLTIGSDFWSHELLRRPVLHVWKEAELRDRRDFDNVFFDLLGLTQGERDAVYEALISLVKSRLDKAKSL